MSLRKNLCVLVAETTGADLDSAPDEIVRVEIQHAIDRCIRRAEVTVGANRGFILKRNSLGFWAGFERCDAAVLATCEILERVQNLPPLRGQRLDMRIGIHYGTVDGVDTTPADTLLGTNALSSDGALAGDGTPFEAIAPAGEGIDVATKLMQASAKGEALASSAAVMLLATTTRHFARPLTVDKPELQTLEWSFYTIGKQPQTVVSVAPTTHLVQRLRIRHQENMLFIDDQRPVLYLGRELSNDVVIMDPRASRQHARIERRREGFVLIDHSSNGSFVLEEGMSGERYLKSRETSLLGPGRIGCGFSTSDVERDLVFFEIL